MILIVFYINILHFIDLYLSINISIDLYLSVNTNRIHIPVIEARGSGSRRPFRFSPPSAHSGFTHPIPCGLVRCSLPHGGVKPCRGGGGWDGEAAGRMPGVA